MPSIIELDTLEMKLSQLTQAVSLKSTCGVAREIHRSRILVPLNAFIRHLALEVSCEGG